jgi:hypothetical protein
VHQAETPSNPGFFAPAEVMVMVEDPERYADKAHLVEMLIAQIGNFDPYAGAGCFDTSVGAETILKETP